MAKVVDVTAPALQNKRRTRALLLLGPVPLVLAALVLLVVSPRAWGAAEVLDAPAWMPSVIGAAVALAGLWVGAYSLRKTRSETAGDFEVFGLQLVFGVFMFISGAAMMLAMAVQLPDAGTYERWLDQDGDFVGRARDFFVISVIYGVLNIGWIWAGAYLYTHAIANMQPNRISRRLPGEVDGVGELLRERQ